MAIKPYNTRNNLERISQRKHYDFDSIENFTMQMLPWKYQWQRGKSLTSGEIRIQKKKFLYNTVFSVTCFYKIFDLPKDARLVNLCFI